MQNGIRQRTIDLDRGNSQGSGALRGFSIKSFHGGGITAAQIAAVCMGIGMFAWGIFAAIVLFIMAVHYLFVTVGDTREWYTVNGCADWAEAVAAGTLSAAIEARQAMSSALCRGLIKEASDTAGFERTLMPALLARQSALREVTLSFSDRMSVLIVTRLRANDGGWEAFIQSNAHDCYLLGLEGCADLPRVRPGWYSFGESLPDDARHWANATDRRCRTTLKSTTVEAFQWAATPDLLSRSLDDDGFVEQAAEGAAAWFTSVDLIFRTGFYFNDTAGERPVLVVGRATVELGELSAERLRDANLGPEGRVYLCSSGGALLAAQSPQEVLVIQPPIGKMRLRNAWELDYGFAGRLREAFPAPGTPPKELRLYDGGLILVKPLQPPYHHFAVLVIAPERGPFTNTLLLISSIVSIFHSTTPLVAFFTILCTLLVRHWLITFVQPAEDELGETEFTPDQTETSLAIPDEQTRAIVAFS